MSYAAEPFGTFVEDLLATLTGGESRVRFTFLPEQLPFRLADHERVQASSVRAHGIVAGAHTEFVPQRDFRLDVNGDIEWSGVTPGFSSPQSLVPDAGTDVWVRFDHLPGGTPPLVNDRNPGSVVRTLAESFAREYAVLSTQLQSVYEAAFVETAGGRDLEQVAALVGLERRGATHARGEVVLRRLTPATADITLAAGALVSTPSAPHVTVETTDTVTLRRGSFSVAAPVRSVVPGPDGVAAARTLSVLHRPVFGVDEVLNPEPLSFGGTPEPDDELRSRVRRALETSGRSTVGAIRGALASLANIREQDVSIEEDHLASPGLVKVTVAAELGLDEQVQAARLIEEHRPAGIRVVHNLPSPTTALPTFSSEDGGGGDGPAPADAATGTSGADPRECFTDMVAEVVLTPADLQLSDEQRRRIADDARARLGAAVAETGAGEPMIYNRLVAALMGTDGILDAVLDISEPATQPPVPGAPAPSRRRNIVLAPGFRPRLADGDLVVELRGERVVLDVTVTVERGPAMELTPPADAVAIIGPDVQDRLEQHFRLSPGRLDRGELLGALPATERYEVEDVSWSVELVDEGLRVKQTDVALNLGAGQVVWVRSVRARETGSMS